MKFVLGIILLAVLVIGVTTIPSVDAASGKLTIRGESSTIYFNESVYFKGKLTDSQGYAKSFTTVSLWEESNVKGQWHHITQGKTDARGEYKITIPANHWNYPKTVIIEAWAEKIRSNPFTLNIEKPYSYQVKQPTNNYVQPNPSKDTISTNLVLKLKDGVRGDNTIQLNPVLTTSGGQEISSGSIDIYMNNMVISTITANQWSENISVGSGFFTFTAKFNELWWAGINYKSSSGKVSYDNSKVISSSTQTTSKTNTDELYKSAASTKFSYSDILNKIESGVKASEYALSNSKLENSEAKKKIDSGWDLRYDVWKYHGEAKKKIGNAEGHINTGQYDYSYKTLVNSESYIYKAKSHLYSILDELKDARDLEKKYQEDRRSCVLFWCSDVKNTYGELDSNIKNLELKLNSLESRTNKLETSKNSFTQSLYKNEINEKNQEIQILENTRKQDQVEAKQEQQRLEEQKQRELNNQRILADQEQRRLEEQKQRELNNQRILADQEKERIREQNRIDEARAQIRTSGKDFPLLTGIANGNKLSFWVEPLPNYVSSNIRTNVNNLISHLDGNWFNGVKLTQTSSEYGADFTINWVTDYNPNHIGRQVGDHLLVGLGSSNCGEWKPFDGTTVYRIMYHEVGHAMGQDHSDNYNNIMYYQTDNQYEYDYKETINLSDGSRQQITLCHSGDVYYTTEKIGNSASYEVYVITPSTDASNFVFNGEGKYYSECSGDFRQSYNSIWKECENLPSGAKLVLYNPSAFGTGSDARIKLEIIETNDHKDVNYNFESSSRYWTQDQLDIFKKLFENNSQSQLNTR